MGSTEFMITLSVLLIAAAVAGVVAQRRAARVRRPPVRAGLDAEAEANHWLIRLGGLLPPNARAWAGADESAGRALTRAAECHRAARARLATARTAAEYEEATRMAREGLDQLRSARTALGTEPVPAPVSALAPGPVLYLPLEFHRSIPRP
ncbi:hypothetical protein ACWC9X_04285 [Streptomyces asoensis]|uniref:hypothetical protein n=1 Tax=Streptomyces TaxID=1883 RepID=UPI00190E5A19|nr:MULTISPECIES: hypothetical protein [unclassified Streptomyces]MBK3628639.1 hypothetical protein [Streptomyces sp. MBT49]MBK3634950.1 hypothetical protein [Streptomyces sp. MBT97]